MNSRASSHTFTLNNTLTGRFRFKSSSWITSSSFSPSTPSGIKSDLKWKENFYFHSLSLACILWLTLSLPGRGHLKWSTSMMILVLLTTANIAWSRTLPRTSSSSYDPVPIPRLLDHCKSHPLNFPIDNHRDSVDSTDENNTLQILDAIVAATRMARTRAERTKISFVSFLFISYNPLLHRHLFSLHGIYPLLLVIAMPSDIKHDERMQWLEV